MIVTIHQPAYLPWLGYFEKIMKSDIYVFLDTVQFEKNSFSNRNKIKTPQGSAWLTVPVKIKGHTGSSLMNLEIDQLQGWRNKHLKSIHANYKKAPRFEECYPKLERLYQFEYQRLSDFCYDQLLFWFKELGISTQIIRSSQMELHSSKSQLVLDICTKLGAQSYISGMLGRDYLDELQFEKHNITITYQNYIHPIYPQLWGDFQPNMSIVDFWMNTDDYRLITGGEQDGLFQ